MSGARGGTVGRAARNLVERAATFAISLVLCAWGPLPLRESRCRFA
ncbi:hypothetical protein ACFZAE_40120 [Streptomyces scabiei]|nr:MULTISPECIES: hypothetical protein [unclassified Streptomyces]